MTLSVEEVPVYIYLKVFDGVDMIFYFFIFLPFLKFSFVLHVNMGQSSNTQFI